MGFAVFALAFVLRLLFWQATPDADWSYPAMYKGDVPVWTQWASALSKGESYEHGIALRPPGAAYLFAWLGGTSIAAVAGLRMLWCLLGAGTVFLLFRAVYRNWGLERAAIFGVLCAGSTGLMVLSISPNNETPYLLLVAASLLLWRGLDEEHDRRKLVFWSGLHGLACLLRAEHVLFYVLLLVLLGRGSSRRIGPRETVRMLALSIVTFSLVLLPWQIKAHTDIEAFNEGSAANPAETEAALRQVEQAVQGIRWTPAALDGIAELPASSRRPAAGFVAATLAGRGKSIVRPEDLGILDEAFGYRPEKLSEYPFVAVYGGLNFFLANNGSATGGFGRGPLEDRPPLVGGPERYPRALVESLPPRQLALAYPPHLQAVNRGYRLGWHWIREHPGPAVRLVVKKLRIFAAGLTLGFGGWNFPLGFDGQRRGVDMATPAEGPGVWAFTACLLLLVIWGLFQAVDDPRMAPWLLFLLYRVFVAAIFFGYARHGALAIPVVVLLMLRIPWSRKIVGLSRALVVFGALLLAAESLRWIAPPEVLLDGRSISKTSPDPFLKGDTSNRSMEIIWPAPD